MTTQETRRLFTNAQPIVTTSELQFQANHASHDPAEREDGKAESTPVDEPGALFALLDDDCKEKPRNGETAWEVALHGRVSIRKIDHLQDETRGRRSVLVAADRRQSKAYKERNTEAFVQGPAGSVSASTPNASNAERKTSPTVQPWYNEKGRCKKTSSQKLRSAVTLTSR